MLFFSGWKLFWDKSIWSRLLFIVKHQEKLFFWAGGNHWVNWVRKRAFCGEQGALAQSKGAHPSLPRGTTASVATASRFSAAVWTLKFVWNLLILKSWLIIWNLSNTVQGKQPIWWSKLTQELTLYNIHLGITYWIF